MGDNLFKMIDKILLAASALVLTPAVIAEAVDLVSKEGTTITFDQWVSNGNLFMKADLVSEDMDLTAVLVTLDIIFLSPDILDLDESTSKSDMGDWWEEQTFKWAPDGDKTFYEQCKVEGNYNAGSFSVECPWTTARSSWEETSSTMSVTSSRSLENYKALKLGDKV